MNKRAVVWVCTECAERHLGRPLVRTHTLHGGECDICRRTRAVLPAADFGPAHTVRGPQQPP